MTQKVRLVHVARLANVSAATASRVLRGHTNVSESTKKRVLAAAEHLNYRPDATARTLRTRSRPLHGVVIDSRHTHDPGERAVWLRFLHRAVSLFTEDGAALVWVITGDEEMQLNLPLTTLTVISSEAHTPWTSGDGSSPQLCIMGPSQKKLEKVSAEIKICFEDEELFAATEEELRHAGCTSPAAIYDLDESQFVDRVKQLIDKGSDGLYICGISSELVIKTVQDLGLEDFPLLVASSGVLESNIRNPISTLEVNPEETAVAWHQALKAYSESFTPIEVRLPWQIHRRESTQQRLTSSAS